MRTKRPTCGSEFQWLLAVGVVLLALALHASAKTVHVFVALCDNASQGIVPVPAKIGNGDDPKNNLYWGCADGLKTCFINSSGWKLVATPTPSSKVVLERCLFQHRKHDLWLVADAYRGSAIKTALTDFFDATSGKSFERISPLVSDGNVELAAGGAADLIAYIGHNGLMEFSLDRHPQAKGDRVRDAIVLCCKSEAYFREPLAKTGSRPLLLTKQFMYPGAFILKAYVEGWAAGESSDQSLARVARAYAQNQKISEKAARGVFVAGGRR